MSDLSDTNEPDPADTDWDAFMASRAKPPRSIRYQVAWVALVFGVGLICRLAANAVGSLAMSGFMIEAHPNLDGWLTSLEPSARLQEVVTLLTIAGSLLLSLGVAMGIVVAFRWAKSAEAKVGPDR